MDPPRFDKLGLGYNGAFTGPKFCRVHCQGWIDIGAPPILVVAAFYVITSRGQRMGLVIGSRVDCAL